MRTGFNLKDSKIFNPENFPNTSTIIITYGSDAASGLIRVT
jgi:hypothetical protein